MPMATNGSIRIVGDIAATSSFSDGLGYSTLVSYMDDERIVFEASSGKANEDQNHTQNDALKLIRILSSILILKAYDLKKYSIRNIC
ncbi:hypothetical protein BD770DRAFT_470688 [Pilaira anomala]|nr:hypothetical protein BD770DRAFT_470688 [Pilaira anomala]